MKTIALLLLLPFLAWSNCYENSLTDMMYSKEATLVSTLTENSTGVSESYYEVNSTNTLGFDICAHTLTKVSIVPLLSEKHIDDTDIRVLLESADGCNRVIYKLTGSISSGTSCYNYPDYTCGKKYQFSFQSKEHFQLYNIKLISGCKIALVQLKATEITA